MIRSYNVTHCYAHLRSFEQTNQATEGVALEGHVASNARGNVCEPGGTHHPELPLFKNAGTHTHAQKRAGLENRNTLNTLGFWWKQMMHENSHAPM